jgi:hypothetical protein
VIIAGTLIHGFMQGDFWSEGRVLTSMPWGRVSLVDVYVGFFLFAGWVIYRESSVLRSGLWILLILVLGNFISCMYAFLALRSSQGDWRRFWMGRHS